ncbi:MAG TPA: twin-arginine translocation signal domain-containing protein [Candidatus Nanoarchaeia archaeon]|nr:twin-arginine translocation signal domain-containing protein [Candidatus Nanoarchaeia archaeon]
MNRRRFLGTLAALGAGGAAYMLWPDGEAETQDFSFLEADLRQIPLISYAKSRTIGSPPQDVLNSVMNSVITNEQIKAFAREKGKGTNVQVALGNWKITPCYVPEQNSRRLQSFTDYCERVMDEIWKKSGSPETPLRIKALRGEVHEDGVVGLVNSVWDKYEYSAEPMQNNQSLGYAFYFETGWHSGQIGGIHYPIHYDLATREVKTERKSGFILAMAGAKREPYVFLETPIAEAIHQLLAPTTETKIKEKVQAALEEVNTSLLEKARDNILAVDEAVAHAVAQTILQEKRKPWKLPISDKEDADRLSFMDATPPYGKVRRARELAQREGFGLVTRYKSDFESVARDLR